MIEKLIVLEDIDPVIFYGVNNANIQLIKALYPKLRIVARHVFEAQIGYDFGPLAVNWYTNFAGADGVNKDGDRAYSSYISLAAPFKLAGLDWTAEIGATPWANDFYNVSADPECSGSDGFAVCDISLGVSKEIKITDSFSVPAFAKVTVNPRTEGAYFVFGLSF